MRVVLSVSVEDVKDYDKFKQLARNLDRFYLCSPKTPLEDAVRCVGLDLARIKAEYERQLQDLRVRNAALEAALANKQGP